MKITIDTSVDSKDEIKKVINLLSHMVGHNISLNENSSSGSSYSQQSSQASYNQSDEKSSSSQNQGDGFMNLFGSGDSTPLKDVFESSQNHDVGSDQTSQPSQERKEDKTNNGIRIIEY
ncbi:MAG: hypothetical protein ACLFUO_03980 [Candidatus Woesearchaeota archaeon]